MKMMIERKIITLAVNIENIVSILQKHGYLSSLSAKGLTFDLPQDTKIVGSHVNPSDLVGRDYLHISLESDSLDDALAFRDIPEMVYPRLS